MSLRVLHVDDEPDIREVVQMSLSLDPDLEVCSCECGRDGLEVAINWSPDLALIDVMMPVMDGPATLAELRKRSDTANIPVVFMTARAQPHELKHFISLGAEGVIQKPFDPMTLAASVRQFAGGATPDMAAARAGFMKKARSLAQVLGGFQKTLLDPMVDGTTFAQIGLVAHSIGEEAGHLNFDDIEAAALKLEAAMADQGQRSPEKASVALVGLLAAVEKAGVAGESRIEMQLPP